MMRHSAVPASVDHLFQLGLEGRETGDALLNFYQASRDDGARTRLIEIVLRGRQGANRRGRVQ